MQGKRQRDLRRRGEVPDFLTEPETPPSRAENRLPPIATASLQMTRHQASIDQTQGADIATRRC